nr:SDR family oxidoreductase [uncultured Hyphomonas sp.]
MLATDLKGKSVLITGAGRGIGAGIAELFVAAGAHVALNDIKVPPAGFPAVSEGGDTLWVAGDVSKLESVEDIVDQVEAWRKIDVLVNCAGVAGELTALHNQSVDDWQNVIDVNLKGTYLMSQAVARYMKQRQSGVILNIASLAGLTGFPASNSYGVSKAAVVMLTKTLATELARYQIRVNAIAPGVIEAPMLGHMTGGKEGLSAVVRRVPLGRLGLPQDIANAAMFLASNAASYITGVTLPVDGGWLAFGGAGDASREQGVVSAY